jgi:hypothetical protein
MKALRPHLDGISNTKYLVGGCNGKGHKHPAAKACIDYTPKVGEEGLQTYDFSGWFLPAGGQWILAYKGLGMTWDDESGNKSVNNREEEREAVKRLLEKAEVSFSTYTYHAWTSTPSKPEWVNTFALSYNYLNPDIKAFMQMPVVPFIAFKRAKP